MTLPARYRMPIEVVMSIRDSCHLQLINTPISWHSAVACKAQLDTPSALFSLLVGPSGGVSVDMWVEEGSEY
jgi:hypothetical protein